MKVYMLTEEIIGDASSFSVRGIWKDKDTAMAYAKLGASCTGQAADLQRLGNRVTAYVTKDYVFTVYEMTLLD